MYNLVKQNILEKSLIKQGDNILIGLSGGPDSVFLFYNLIKLKLDLSFNLYASHINHMYRGNDAMHDEDFVRELCSKYNIKLFIKRKHAGEYAKELKLTEEEAGRILRYNFFADNLKEIGKGKIAVAHNLNDQAETVLQRIIRGTGIDGLSAMTYEKDNIIRPILNVEKSEILNYLHQNNYEYCIDKTNLQDIYGRNKIRLNLIPYLEKNFNPNIQSSLFRMSEVISKDKEIIDKYINLLFKDVLIEKTNNKIILDINKLKAMDEGEKRRIIRKAIYELKYNTKNIEMKHVDYAIDFIKYHTTGKKINLSENLTVEISYDNFIVNKMVEKVPKFQYNIELNKTLFIKEINKSICCKLISLGDLEAFNFSENMNNSVNVDYDLVKGELLARNRLPGDYIIPCNMNGSKKIKDIFIDLKVPLDEREARLIIADDDNIIWLEGFRIHNSYKVTNKTKKILNISVEDNL